MLGSGGNYLTAFNRWPDVTYSSFYLGPDGEGGRAGLLGKDIFPPSGDVGYYYDPSNPAPTYGGWIFQSAPSPGGVGCVDQSPLSVRQDVLQFNSLRLRKELAICGGDITATLTVSSTANDTDFIVRLVDQYPDGGERYLVAEGIVRMRWRNHTLVPLAMHPEREYTVDLDRWFSYDGNASSSHPTL